MKRILTACIIALPSILSADAINERYIYLSPDDSPEQLVRKLWQGIPNLAINEYTRYALTPDLYELVEECYRKYPRNVEFTHWYTTDTPLANALIQSVKINSATDSRISATVVFRNEDYDEHTIILTKDDYPGATTSWQIADFDRMYSRLSNQLANPAPAPAPAQKTTAPKSYDNTSRGVVTQEGSDDSDRFKAVQEQVVVKIADPEPPKTVEEKKPESEKIFTAVESQAQFPGGQAALMRWLSTNLRYPERAQQADIQGRVIVKFVVNADGSIEQASVVRGVDPDLNAEAIRVIKQMPRWQPGKNNGQAVRSFFTLPITFKLSEAK